MMLTTRTDAQQHTDDIHVFRRELGKLERNSILVLTDSQKTAVSAHHDAILAEYAKAHDIDRDARGKQLSLGMRIASFLGALALAASVFFLFYQFWGLFGEGVQVGVLLFAAFGTFVGTMWIQKKDASGYFTKLAAMVAFACFVLNLTMLGQIFNITPSDRVFVVLAAYGLLLAYACDARLLLAAGILCIIAFISARTGTICGMYWLDVGERPENFFPAALLLFFVPQMIRHERFSGFGTTYRVFGLLTLFIPILVLGNWGSVSYLMFDKKIIEGIYQVLGFVLSAGVIWFGARRNWPAVVNTGMSFFVIFLYTKFYNWWWEIMPKYLFFLLIGLSAVLLLLVMKRMRVATVKFLGGGQA